MITMSCKTIPFEEYKTISFEEIISLKKINNELEVILIDLRDKIIKDQSEINLEYYCSEFRLKSADTIYRKVVKATPSIDERMLQVLYQNIPLNIDHSNFEQYSEIDCHDLEQMIDTLKHRDLQVRIKTKDISREYFRKINRENAEIVKAILKKCGLVEDYSHELWLFIQHAPYEMQVRYYEDLNIFYKNGIISAPEIALLRDRILLQSGYHQEYGSQLNEETNYKIYDFENVDSLRKEMGMVPLEEYIEILWGSDWKKSH